MHLCLLDSPLCLGGTEGSQGFPASFENEGWKKSRIWDLIAMAMSYEQKNSCGRVEQLLLRVPALTDEDISTTSSTQTLQGWIKHSQ